MYKLKQKVYLKKKFLDGRTQHAYVIGSELLYEYLSYKTEKHYLNSLSEWRYKIVYFVGGKGHIEWVHHNEISKDKPL